MRLSSVREYCGIEECVAVLVLLYASFLSLSCKCWPQKFCEINNKMKPLNFLIDWLKAKELGWPRYQADSLGKEFVVLLADALWYPEGRHGSSRSSPNQSPVSSQNSLAAIFPN